MKIKRILPEAIFTIITIFCCAVAFSTFFKSHVIEKHGGRTQGKIVRLETSGDSLSNGNSASGSSKGSVFPVVHFTTLQGQEVEQTSRIGFSSGRFKEGQTVTVIYDKDNPLLWQINSWWDMYVLPIIFATIGVILGGFTLIRVAFKLKSLAGSK
ncbi:MAG: DUF3592 domain-containing protein [Candidatus Melainabacteria bacterium]|nr:DUF3592 domain-containing protein [Candidatus Melainabacteria bacterium]